MRATRIRVVRIVWLMAAMIGLVSGVMLAVRLGSGEKLDANGTAARNAAETFVALHDLGWEGFRSVNDSHMPHARWEVWSLHDRQMIEVAADGRIVSYIDFYPPERGSPPLSAEELTRASNSSGLLPPSVVLTEVSYSNGINYAQFNQRALGRVVRFNAVKIAITGKTNVAGFSTRWTEFDPYEFDVRITGAEAAKICQQFFKSATGSVTGTDLVYVVPNDFFGPSGEKGVHLAYQLRYLFNMSEPEYFAELWVDASSGKTLGGDAVP